MRNFFDVRKLAVLLIGTALLNSCQCPPEKNPQQLYEQGIADSAIVSPEKRLPLLPLPANDRIEVVSWVTASRIPCTANNPLCTYTTGNDRLWVTLAGEVQQQCQLWHLSGDALRRRLEQLLGLPMDSPPQYRKVQFITLQVARNQLQRPCLGVDEQDPKHPSCTLTAQPDTPSDTQNYVLQQMANVYVIHNPKGPGYPFTRLGYTYDWNPNNKTHYGASEFLLAPNSAVTVVASNSTDDYCQMNPH